MLTVRMGNMPGSSFMVKVLGLEPLAIERDGHVLDGEVRTFTRAAIKFGGTTGQRMFVIEPADEPNEFVFGAFFVRGRYRVIEKVNNPATAAERWLAFGRSLDP